MTDTSAWFALAGALGSIVLTGRAGRVSGDLGQPLAGEEHKPGINRSRSSGR
jgi:hypothetical protein